MVEVDVSVVGRVYVPARVWSTSQSEGQPGVELTEGAGLSPPAQPHSPARPHPHRAVGGRGPQGHQGRDGRQLERLPRPRVQQCPPLLLLHPEDSSVTGRQNVLPAGLQ